MKKYKLAVIKGDGIGPEIVNEALKILDSLDGFDFEFNEFLMGGVAYDACGEPLPQKSIDGCLESDSVLFGAIGGEKWDSLPREKRPESGLLKLRKALGVFANIRPSLVYDELLDASTLKPEVIKGVDIVVVRELIGGIYFGEPKGRDENRGFNTMVYTRDEVERIAKVAFELAMKRGKKVCSYC